MRPTRSVVDDISRLDQATRWDLPGAGVDGDDQEAAWQTFDLHALVSQIRSVLTVAARAKGIALVVRASPTLPSRVIGDPGHLRQALAVLLENAIGSTERGEVVASISADPCSHARISLCVEISDTGAGAERLDAADAARLTLSRTLVELMDGQLERSSAHGAGSTCRFRLPLGLPRPLLVVA